MGYYLSLRGKLKKINFFKQSYYNFLFLKNKFFHYFKVWGLNLFDREDATLLKEVTSLVRKTYPMGLPLTDGGRFFAGKNILGYPAMGLIELEGEKIGWGLGKLVRNGLELPVLQMKTDIETNMVKIFEKYKPEIIVDFGTCGGGTAVFFWEMASKYCQPKILSLDITDEFFYTHSAFHKAYGTKEKVSLIFGKSTLDAGEEVKKFLQQRKPGQRVLLSFDDDHHFRHTYKELVLYGAMLQSGDIILMQDTWIQGLFGFETSPLLAVYKYLKGNYDFAWDEDFNKQMIMPCNFIHGLIYKK